MTRVASNVVRCDGTDVRDRPCLNRIPATTGQAWTMAQVRREALRLGWVRDNGRDVCPRCIALEAERARASR